MKRQELLDLLDSMSLEEKINQLLQLAGVLYESGGAVTGPAAEQGFTEGNIRLAGSVLGTVGAEKIRKIQKEYMSNQPHHIPMLFMADIINGYKTIFPIPLAQGCTFDPEVVREGAAVAARESAAAGLHVTFSPMADLVRDARWGRVMEATGEDVYLNSCMAEAAVRGYQGDDVRQKGRIAACVKHFAAYGFPTAGRDYNNVELSERTLREDYLPAYRAGIGAGSELVMTSFNTLNRIPATGNKELMKDILRGEMGFEGVLISDWAAIHELVIHGIAQDDKEAAKMAIEAGVDIDMMTPAYSGHLKELIEEGCVPEESLDRSVLRVLELKNKLGLFENPYKDADIKDEENYILCEKHRETARQAAVKSFVLLKNEEAILPLREKEETVAFIGPYVNNKLIFGLWSIFGDKEDCVTIQEAIQQRGAERVLFAEGGTVLDPGIRLQGFAMDSTGEELDDNSRKKMFAEALEAAARADKVVMAIGEHPLQSGEAGSRADITIPEEQQRLLEAVYEVNQEIAVVLFNGRPLDLRRVVRYAKAVLDVWFPGTEGGNAIADVLYGAEVPSGRLAMSFPHSAGQIPVFYSEFSTGRPAGSPDAEQRFASRYIDIPNEPMYPFGYGLSYTSFAYSPVMLNNNELGAKGTIEASVIVKNTGCTAGTETVQLYIRDMKGSVVRPVRELKGFQKADLGPGEKRKVNFQIDEKMLRFYNRDMEFDSEAGEFAVYIGADSRTQNKAEFLLIK